MAFQFFANKLENSLWFVVTDGILFQNQIYCLLIRFEMRRNYLENNIDNQSLVDSDQDIAFDC